MSFLIRMAANVPFLALALTACSSGNGGTGDHEIAPQLVQARVVSVEQDTDGDGAVDDIYGFSYDADGRVAEVSLTAADFSTVIDTLTFAYADGSLVSIDGDSMSIKLTNANGRVVAYDDGYDSFTYTYNESGQLVNVVGDEFSFDGDCNDPIPFQGDDSDTTDTLNTLSYDSAGRFVGAQGSEGGIFSVEYLNDSVRPVRLTSTSKCSTSPDEIVVFEYNDQGLPESAAITSDEGFYQDRYEIQLEYDPARRPTKVMTREIRYSGEQRQSTQTFQYNSDGLLETTVLSTTVLSSSGNLVANEKTTFLYEAETCVEQVYPGPIESLLLDQLAQVRTYEAGLRCGFYAFVIGNL